MTPKTEHFDGKISIITAVYNAEHCIQHLIDSLRQQTDKSFEWVVVDGLSTDNTLEILKKIDDLNIRIISEADFGIYDALNKGIKACAGEYYLVAGADDIFFSNAIVDYKAAIENNISLITATIIKNKQKIQAGKGASCLYGQFQWISDHALGTLIKKDLHDQYGFYSRKFPIAADQLFIKVCCQNNEKIKKINSIVGEFGIAGVSSIDTMGTCTEFFRVQLLTGENKWVQFILLLLKLTKRIVLY